MACFLFGVLLGVGGLAAGVWLLLYTGGLSREGFARILNGIAIGLMQGKKKPRPAPPPEPPPAAIPVRLLPERPRPEVIDIPPPKAQDAADAPARPNLLVPPDGANGGHGRAARPAGGPKRQRGQ